MPPTPNTKPPTIDPAFAVTNSAMWAAWGDAVGFIAELTDEAGLRRRTKGQPLAEPVEWKRRVGGKFGVSVTLPSGCYSDDTQLRLATSRAITTRGFDVEAFAKVEMPVWPTYALGGGKASKAAAANLAKPTTPWFANFFDGYLMAGGNGAAMRIQPHVWAANHTPISTRQPSGDEYIIDVLRNGVTTHGHPRALVGAVLHAVSLATTLRAGSAPGTRDWNQLLEDTRRAGASVRESDQLELWRGVWEQHADTSFEYAWLATVDECATMLDKIRPSVEELARQHPHDPAPRADPEALSSAATTTEAHRARNLYAEVVELLDLTDPGTRGSGTATVCASLATIAFLAPDPYLATLIPATAVGTDTDTIATMVGAIVGAASPITPPGPIQDHDYHEREARRLVDLAQSRSRGRLNERPDDNFTTVPDFAYPDLLNWTPPRSQIDSVGLVGDDLALAGVSVLGLDPNIEPTYAKDSAWLWATTTFGQSLLVKMRHSPGELRYGNWPAPRRSAAAPNRDEMPEGVTHLSPTRAADDSARPAREASVDTHTPGHANTEQPDLFSDAAEHQEPRNLEQTSTMSDEEGLLRPTTTEPTADAPVEQRRIDVDEMLRWVWKREATDEALGYAVRRLAESGTIEQLIAFAVSARAMVERKGRSSQ